MQRQNQKIFFNKKDICSTKDTQHYGQLYGSATSLAIAENIENKTGPKIIITPDMDSAEKICIEVNFFTDFNFSIALFPDLEILPYDISPPSKQVIANRSEILFKMTTNEIDVLVLNAANLLWRLPPKDFFTQQSFSLQEGQSFSMNRMKPRLKNNGYERASLVTQPGEFCVRGSLIDVFSPLYKNPIRVDFEDDKIDSIRVFDIDSQMTVNRIKKATIIPSDQYPKNNETIDFFKINLRNHFEGNQLEWPLYNFIESDAESYGVHNYLPFFFKSMSSIWDYCTSEYELFCLNDIKTPIREHQKIIQERFKVAGNKEQPSIDPSELFFDAKEQINYINNLNPINIQNKKFRPSSKHHIHNFQTKPIGLIKPSKTSSIDDNVMNLIETSTSKVLLSITNTNHFQALKNQFNQHPVVEKEIKSWKEFLKKEKGIYLTQQLIHQSFIAPKSEIMVIGEEDLFGKNPRIRKKSSLINKNPESIIQDLKDLKVGSLVVHDEYGVGIYQGLSSMKIDDIDSEFLTIEYALGDLLHVPVILMDYVSRYIGQSTDKSILSHLGSDQWKKLCNKTKQQTRDVAAELLEIYANRKMTRGRRHIANQTDYENFCDGFEYILTKDQAKVIDDVLNDMASSKSMERLVCGDVGFGKTEVALRATFTAAINGFQVAILVPTTLLARQHYETFSERFLNWPINVNILSRLQTSKKNQQLRKNIKSGYADIVIGTHALLSDKVVFKNLGLVIVDEEHRFGVRHKEKLKGIKKDVDYLTLTATPIPRTLNMAIGDLKDISMITTPPEGRIPVKTFISQWDRDLIREACQREINRGGQILFIHNKIDGIENIAESIKQIMPEISLEMAHGQMKEKSLEKVMLQFYHNECDILLATSIVESGLDIPNANTIIINKADRFGLAQLHQLRGRVGRSERQSYAYLIVPPKNQLTTEGTQRLEAIEAIEDLGVGFILATHDLEIRGAGEILGDEQSGQIQKIGFSLYKDMLAQAINSLKDSSSTQSSLVSCDINLNIPALIPENYMPDVHLRLTMYKRISKARSKIEINDIKHELIDRFGDLPKQTKNLLLMAHLRNKASGLGINKIRIDKRYGRIFFDPSTSIETKNLINLIDSEPDIFKMFTDQSLGFKGNFPQVDDRVLKLRSIISYFEQDLV